MILWGIGTDKCVKCRGNYEQAKKDLPCIDGACILLQRPAILHKLSYQEFRMLNMLIEFQQSNVLPTSDEKEKDLLLFLNAYTEKLIRSKGTNG